MPRFSFVFSKYCNHITEEYRAARNGVVNYFVSNGYDTPQRFVIFFLIPFVLSVIISWWAWSEFYKIADWELDPEFIPGHRFEMSDAEPEFVWGQRSEEEL